MVAAIIGGRSVSTKNQIKKSLPHPLGSKPESVKKTSNQGN